MTDEAPTVNPDANLGAEGTILVWVFPIYGTLDPAGLLEPSISPLGAEFPEEHAPARAKTVIFSSFSHEIAYVHPTQDNQFSLWISDSHLIQPNRIWVDEQNLSGWAGPDDLIYLRWKMNDQFILIWDVPIRGPTAGEDYWVVYSRVEQKAIQLDGPCNYLTTSPLSAELSIYCPAGNGQFVVLEISGDTWETDQIPEGAVPIKDWAFSKDGKRVIYAADDDRLYIMDVNGRILGLPTGYHPGQAHIATRVFQWADDGSKILISGDDERCPYSDFAGRRPTCWMIYDGITGEFLWSPPEPTGFDAALSPDGNYVASFFVDHDSPLAEGYGIIYSLQTGGSWYFFAGLADTLSWEE